MNMKLLVLVIFIVTAQTVLILAVECFSDPSISAHNAAGKKVRGLNETGEFSENTDGRPAISVTRKGSKGKGAYGGANLVHRPPRTRNAASSSAAPPFLVFSAMLATFSLICPCRF